MKHNFNLFFNALFALALVMSVMFGVVTPVAAQNTNVTDWEDKAYVADFAAGKVNAIFEPENPIPAEAPKEVLEALKRGAWLVMNEPYKDGCGGDNPVENLNCNVGLIRSFTDWNDMRDFVYGKSEGNPGHFGPWNRGSFKISFVREMTPDEMDVADWAAYMRGEVRVNFTENKPLPATDPTNGLVNHALSEPWRGGCDGNSENPNCQVGSAEQGSYKAVLDYLKKGNWTRGSIVAWPKEAVQATAVPSNTPAVTNTPAAGSATGTATIPPTATVQPTFTATPGAVGEEVPTNAEAALPAAETPREGGGYGWLLGLICIVVIALLGWAFWYFLIHLPAKNSRQAEQPAEEGAGEENLEQPAEEGAGEENLDSILGRHRGE